MSPSTASAVHRRMVVLPAIASLVLLALALPWHLAGSGLDFLPFLLGLVGGALGGMAFLNWTLGMRRRVTGTLVHLAGTLLLSAGLYVLVSTHGALLDGLPEPVRMVIFLLQMSAIPAVGWLWLGLIGRLSSAVTRPSATRPAPVAPEWVDDPAGTYVEVPAVPLTMRALTMIIVGIVVLVGAVLVAVLIGFDLLAHITSPRFLILFAGLLFALPAYAALRRWCAVRTVPCRIAFHGNTVTVTVDGAATVFPLADIDELRWATATDYARVEIRTHRARLDLLVGMAKTPKGTLAQLPRLRGRFERALTGAGLERQRTKRAHLSVFRRTLPHGKRPVPEENPSGTGRQRGRD